MAYEIDDIITAAGAGEYNDFVGAQGTSVYASQVDVDAAAPSVGSVYGQGFGNRGYGQTAFILATVTAGDVITSAQWTNMRNALAVIREQQTGAVPVNVPPTTVLEVGDIIQAHEQDAPTSDTFDFNSEISLGDTNRFVMDSINAGSFATSGTSSNTRGSAWGSGTGSIDLTFDVAFSTEDDARFFFNSGGEIRITLTHPSGTLQDDDWQDVLQNKLGRVDFNHTQTTSQGTSGLNSSIGYYDLTGSFQTIINGTNLGGGAYSSNDVLIEARRESFSGANGGNGTTVRFRITLTDEHTSSFDDTVSAGTAADFAVLKSIFLSGIETPIGSVIDSF